MSNKEWVPAATLQSVSISDAYDPVPLMSRPVGDIEDLRAANVVSGLNLVGATSATSIGAIDGLTGWGGAGVLTYGPTSLSYAYGSVARTTGAGIASISGAGVATLSGITVSQARGAGFIGKQATLDCTRCVAEGTLVASVPAGDGGAPITGIGDGFATFAGSMNLAGCAATGNGRAGFLYEQASGKLTTSTARGNQYGLAYDGDAPMYGDDSVFTGNSVQDILQDGNLAVPGAPQPAH